MRSRTPITLLVFAVALFWYTQAAPAETPQPISNRTVIAHTTYAAVTPIANDHTVFYSQPVAHALQLADLREVIWTSATLPLKVEGELLEAAKPIPIQPRFRIAVRKPAPLAPEFYEGLIEQLWFEADWDWARRVGACESGWNANARNPSGAAGVYQFMPRTWDSVAARLGFGDYASGDVYDPVKNMTAAAWLFYNVGPSQWVCK